MTDPKFMYAPPDRLDVLEGRVSDLEAIRAANAATIESLLAIADGLADRVIALEARAERAEKRLDSAADLIGIAL